MLDPNLPELRVFDYTACLQKVQAMDSRGDFSFKGIYKVLLVIFEWTDKFLQNKVLPNTEQIERDSSVDRDRIEAYVNDLCFKQNPPILKKLNVLEFHPNEPGDPENARTYLKHNTVFARPTTADGGTAFRYALGLNEHSVVAIKSWFEEKRKYSGKEKMKKVIKAAVDANRLFDTYAATEIGNLFQCPYDKTKPQKDATIVIHLKPVLKQLVDDKILFFFRNDAASRPGNKSVFIYNKPNEIADRYDAYVDYVKNTIYPALQKLGVMGNLSEEVWNSPRATLTEILGYMNDSYGDQKTLIEETLVLNEIIEKDREKEEKQKRKQQVEDLMLFLEQAGRIVELNQLRVSGEPLSDEFRAILMSQNDLLYAEYADRKIYNEFILHKGCVQQAIESAKRSFATKRNDLEIRVLNVMNVTVHLMEEGPKRIFEEIEAQSLFQFLPFLTKLWRMMIGSNTVHKHEIPAIKARLQQQLNKDLVAQKNIKIAQEKERIVRARLKEKEVQEKEGEKQTKSSSDNDSDSEPVKQGTPEEEKKWKESMESIVRILDEAWDFGIYPDREYVLTKLSGAYTEENLIFFLKKFGGKEIYSFPVRNQREKFPWPILVSASYLKRQGKRLLEKVSEESNRQRNEKFPNQEKFDIAESLLEFLNRILPRLKP
ncbi:hypothetical protein LPTSP3_g36570 [Leptospira kobayashii]|uniref:Uncharacterized protein n=1 Tax=Leptospira kobayashii TaxID=1917830 RepID=A0ABM7UNL8_9LEPT|nr:hypothetical protein [Leptospira kobayashii]BDA80727.1 hypothetical protein LPTSP3_g36570 [Leptospira kobayashii]